MTTAQSTYKSIYNALSSGVFAIEPRSAMAYYPAVRSFLDGNVNAFQGFYSEEVTESDNYYEEDSVTAVISISGVILKDGTWCTYGTSRMAKKIESLSNSEKVKNILIKIDSPGGMVDGTERLANAIANCKKPTLAFVNDGMACSAAYWIGSHADQMWASKKMDRVGSIGTMIEIANMDKYYEAMGVEFHEIYATKSTDKNQDFAKAKNGDYSQIVQGLLDPMNETFLAAIRAARPSVKEECLTGKVYLAEEAISLGLLDKIGSYSEALQYLTNQSKEAQTTTASTTSNSQSISILTPSSMSFLTNLFNSSKTEEEAAEKLNNELSAKQALEASNKTLSEENAALQERISALEKENTSLQASNEALTAENEKYSTIAGTAHTQPTVAADTKETTALDNTEEDVDRKVLEASPHTQRANRLLGYN